VTVLGLRYAHYVRLYRPSQRRLKIQESNSRSPMSGTVIEALSGMDCIGTSPSLIEHFTNKYKQNLDSNADINWGIKNSDRWLSVRLEVSAYICSVNKEARRDESA